jgi:hypothetical protein
MKRKDAREISTLTEHGVVGRRGAICRAGLGSREKTTGEIGVRGQKVFSDNVFFTKEV